MKKFLAMFLVLTMMLSIAACGNKDAADGTEGTTAATDASVVEGITEEDAKACLVLSAESWMCDIFGESVEAGAEVSAKIDADYYISEAEDAPYDVKSVAVRHVKFGDNEIVPIQTADAEKAAEMLTALGYGTAEELVLVGDPLAVFHFDAEISGIYDEKNLTIDVPYEISCNVVFESGEEVVVNFTDVATGVGSGGYIDLDEAVFVPYQAVEEPATDEGALQVEGEALEQATEEAAE